jgi:3-hydroxybutyryl-CoA dehydrogenase
MPKRSVVHQEQFRRATAALAPLENADLVGLDLIEDIHKVILPISTAHGPEPAARRKGAQRAIWVKSGKGFYDWTPEKADEVRSRMRVICAPLKK